jgi:hypothetical protein
MLKMARSLGALVAPLLAAACSGPAAETAQPVVIFEGSDAQTDGSEVSCVDDARVDTYTANLDRMGQQHVLKFTLVESNPAPPSRGINVMKLKIAHADGSAVTGELLAKLAMPDHGHPTTVQPLITLDAVTGTYTIDPAYLFMPGVWRLEFDSFEASADAGAPLDTGVYYFCVEG